MTPIVVSTKGGSCLEVLRASINVYAPQIPLLVYQSSAPTFGDAYNYAMAEAFGAFDEIIIANDDVVLTPNTIPALRADVTDLRRNVDKLGFVAARADNIRGLQKSTNPGQDLVVQTPVLSPVFAWISKKAFSDVQFPPLNWFSDDVMCEDLNKLGYRHFLSRAYVHHVGSATIMADDWRHYNEAMPWLRANRPSYVQKWNLQ